MDAIPFLLMRLYRFLNNIPFVKKTKKIEAAYFDKRVA
jgi:hypothetical protein